MQIQKVILSSNCDFFYLDFWPLVSKIWRKKFNIIPVLFLIHDDKSVRVSEEYGEVVYFNPLPDVPVHIQTQCVRYWYPVTELETTWMTSDIDMLPMSKKYFVDSLEHIPDDKFVNLNANKIGAFSCCYNVAKGKTFKEILNLTDSYKEYLDNTEWFKFQNDHNNGNKYFNHWGVDEGYPNKLMSNYHDKTKFVLTKRHDRPGGEGVAAYRLDRIGKFHWNTDLVHKDYYIDAHCPRPYTSHKTIIDSLVSDILYNT